MSEDKNLTSEEHEALKEDKIREAAALRERAKILIMRGRGNAKRINEGLCLLKQAFESNDPEAAFIIGKLTLDGYLEPKNGNREETAMKQLAVASEMGSLQAKVLLNELCSKRYEKDFYTVRDKSSAHPLVDFDGEVIKIDESGNRIPVDAKLEFDGTKNHLTFSLNLFFEDMVLVKNPEQFRDAVIEGIKEWEGDYSVFGGQPLKVSIEVTTEDRSNDSVHVYLFNEEVMGFMERLTRIFAVNKNSTAFQNSERIVNAKNSFAFTGRKWKVSSKKTICIVQDENDDNVFTKIKEKTKHEFGHVLGLGDLYKDSGQGLTGVEKGEYLELDSFHINKNLYQLIMCTNHGVISNNDIEMIILAFRENAMQVYQKQRGIKKVSEALGQGN